MKKIFGLLIAVVMVLALSLSAHATLLNRGTDSLDNRLIYDDDLDITWYDYTKSYGTWQNHVDWAAALTVDFGGTSYNDWRLPSALNQDGSGPGFGFYTDSEMGHLYYTALGNSAGWGLSNTGPFTDLQPYGYWAGTEYAANPYYAWGFNFYDGSQSYDGKVSNRYALAVRPGDVAAPIPEPATMLLLGSGLAGMGLFKKVRRRHG